mgnify:CR=1 FL=1
MIEEYLDLIAVVLMASVALVLFLGVEHVSTPSVCQAVKLALENPGSEFRVFGNFKTENSTAGIYLSCGLLLPKNKVLAIEDRHGYLIIGSTADGKIYIR